MNDDNKNNYVLSDDTIYLLQKIVGDTGENEGVEDVIKRIATFYLKNVRFVGNYYEEMRKKDNK